MKKEQKNAFGKNIYLLGKDEQGQKYWLEAPSWDCGWYWGFGYVETYTNNRSPENSKDISSHQHIETSFLGEKNGINGEYCYNIFDAELLKGDRTFTEEEGWELSELFNQFYFLSESAKRWRDGKANTAKTSIINWKDEDLAKKINEEIIPIITSRIIEILSPSN